MKHPLIRLFAGHACVLSLTAAAIALTASLFDVWSWAAGWLSCLTCLLVGIECGQFASSGAWYAKKWNLLNLILVTITSMSLSVWLVCGHQWLWSLATIGLSTISVRLVSSAIRNLVTKQASISQADKLRSHLVARAVSSQDPQTTVPNNFDSNFTF